MFLCNQRLESPETSAGRWSEGFHQKVFFSRLHISLDSPDIREVMSCQSPTSFSLCHLCVLVCDPVRTWGSVKMPKFMYLWEECLSLFPMIWLKTQERICMVYSCSCLIFLQWGAGFPGNHVVSLSCKALMASLDRLELTTTMCNRLLFRISAYMLRIVLKYTLHKISHFIHLKVYNSVIFGTFTVWYNHRH
jgi:hypothetical protein